MHQNERSAILAELDRIEGSDRFQRAPVLSRLLRFVVETTLIGKGDTLSAYVLAVDCLGRGDDFDPQTDSYPRVQMGRLRKLLKSHYADDRDAASAGDIRIALTPGNYAPEFITAPLKTDLAPPSPVQMQAKPISHMAPASAAAVDMVDAGQIERSVRTNRILVYAFGGVAALACGLLVLDDVSPPIAMAKPNVTIEEATTQRTADVLQSTEPDLVPKVPVLILDGVKPLDLSPASAALARRYNAALLDYLPRFRQLSVRSASADRPDDAYILTGTVSRAPSTTIAVRLSSGDTGKILWSREFETPSGEEIGVDRSARLAAAMIAQQRGIIHSREARRQDGGATYKCLLQWRHVHDSRDVEKRADTLACLDNALARDSRNASVVAARAWLLAEDEAGVQLPRTQMIPAVKAAEMAVRLAPSNSFARLTLARMYFLQGNPAQVTEENEALRLNPADPDISGYVGLQRIYRGDPTGRDMVEEALDSHANPPPAFDIALAIAAMTVGDDEEVAKLAGALGLRATPATPNVLWRAIAQAARSDQEAAIELWRDYLANDPNAASNFEGWLQRFGIRADVARDIVGWLNEKGLALPA
ncbi:MAG: hypothetical protein WA906_13015 [Pacificimonas sp.]